MSFAKKIYQNNIQIIKNAIPEVYNRLIAANEKNCKICISKSGHKNLSKNINGNDIFIHSNENPVYQAKYVANEILKEKNEIIFVFGVGLGYELDELLKKDRNKIYFMVEPDINIFKCAMHYIDINSLINRNVLMVISDDIEQIMQSFKYIINEKRTLSCKFSVLLSYNTIYKELISNLNAKISDFFKDIKTDLFTTHVRQRKWLYNYICNLKSLDKAVSIKVLENKFENIPVIIVGAGPSLNYELENLRQVEKKAIIVAVGTAVKVLLKNKIKFHIAAAVDADEQAFIIEDMNEVKNHILLYSNQVDPSVVDRFDGPKFIFNQSLMDNFILQTLNYNHYERYSGPSISNIVATNLASLGCKTIIFLGQDMCYVNKNLYASGAEEDNSFSDKVPYIRMTNIRGEEVYTETQFLAIKNSMERCISNNRQTKFYNGTKDGLNIEGAANIDFTSYLSEKMNEQYNILDNIYEIYNKLVDEINKEEIDEFILHIKNSNEEIIDICKKIVGFVEENNKLDIVEECYKKLTNIKFFNYLLNDMIKYCDYIYSEKDILEKTKQTYSYIAEKCLLMRTAFEDELGIK